MPEKVSLRLILLPGYSISSCCALKTGFDDLNLYLYLYLASTASTGYSMLDDTISRKGETHLGITSWPTCRTGV